jgi:hypothetical protein
MEILPFQVQQSNLQEGTLCCYEMAGTRGGREAFFDLLADRAQVKCLTGEDGNVHVRGAKQAMMVGDDGDGGWLKLNSPIVRWY